MRRRRLIVMTAVATTALLTSAVVATAGTAHTMWPYACPHERTAMLAAVVDVAREPEGDAPGVAAKYLCDDTRNSPQTATGNQVEAMRADLVVTPYTFRAENSFLPTDYRLGTNPADYGRAIDEDVAFMKAGVDGLFCDQPDICVTARKEYLGRD